MTERRVRIRSFNYFPKEGVERIARRGDVIDFSEEDIERGERFDAFEKGKKAKAADDSGSTGEVEVRDLPFDELVTWVSDHKVQEVVDASGGDAGFAHQLLDAENAATGRDPRVTVVEGLAAVVARAST